MTSVSAFGYSVRNEYRV